MFDWLWIYVVLISAIPRADICVDSTSCDREIAKGLVLGRSSNTLSYSQ